MIVIAEENELPLAKRFYPNEEVKVIGVGINAIKVLSQLPKNERLHNVGYVGGWNIPIGTIVSVNKSRAYHPNVNYKDETYLLDAREGLMNVPCYTSLDFVTANLVDTNPCVFDMELALICAMGFEVDSIKVVSDNLNYKQYEQSTKEN